MRVYARYLHILQRLVSIGGSYLVVLNCCCICATLVKVLGIMHIVKRQKDSKQRFTLRQKLSERSNMEVGTKKEL
uniref:Putative ovule protein n=1 Tax=Solanum chacoense TaxID=4108 RepID=A0A0V0HG71_SOLCH